ncbi:MAG: beta-ketoacyl synthase, partial [Acidobacteria bacterium]|nr:beta-ketoacyl synthase [Acidobacteriota bacterium]
SKGGSYPVRYALRLGAGFGSQISLTLTRWTPMPHGNRQSFASLGFSGRIVDPAAWEKWLRRMTGSESPELEVVQRTLRVRDGRLAARKNDVAAAQPAAPLPIPSPAPAEPAAAAHAAKPVATAPSAAAPPPAANPVRSTVMRIISEQTGYPPDMLELDLDLEADLGIDTVKQAEMFAAIRAAYDIPRDDALKLRDFPTLAHAIQFVYDRRPDLKRPEAAAPPAAVPAAGAVAAAAAASSPAPPAAQASPVEESVREKVLEIVSANTGYPKDMLELDLDLEADLGIDTVKQAEMFAAIRAAYDIPRDDALKLRDFPTLAHAIQFVFDRRPDLKSAAAAAPAAGPARSAHEAPAADPVQETVLGIIADKTGYPPDMLDLDLDLEADLGIDTVKQAEMFAAIRAAYDIPRDDALKLRDFPTLAHAIQFVYDRRPDLRATAEAIPAGQPPAEAKHAAEELAVLPPAGDMLAADAVPRRVPVPFLRPPIDLCKPTGVRLGSRSRVLIMADEGGIGKALAGRLEKLDATPLLVEGAPEAETLVRQIDTWKAEGPVQGVFWLPALDPEAPFAEMNLASWREATRVRVKLLYTAMRALYDQVGGAGTFLVAASRLGGLHGYDLGGAPFPLGGCVTGFAKAFQREKPDALVKAVDFEPSRKTSALADILIDETLWDPGAVEIGYSRGRRWTVGLEQQPATAGGTPGMVLGKDSVFVITGAAGSIVSAITADLAAASRGTFHLLDLTPAPDPADPELQLFGSDREALKRQIFDRLKAEAKRATPAM